MKSRCLLRLTLSVLAMFSIGSASALTGAWRGELELGQMKLPIVFNFSESAEGATSCTLDSPAQGAKGIPAQVVKCTADSISITCSAIGASYEGRVTPDSIDGKFRQGIYTLPLLLTPEASLEERRPQTPRPPFPYTTLDTVFTAPDGAILSATLTLPPDYEGNRIPAVVMLTGSGLQNRDEEIFEHRPFAVIADYLARNGVASLRYDDRGAGKSTGDTKNATTFTFEEDARRAMEFLESMDLFGKIGVIGHSEGGTIAFMLAAEENPDFIISLAGMAETGKQTLMRQNRRGLDASPLTEAEKAGGMKVIGEMFDIMADQYRIGVSDPVDVDSIAAASGIKLNPQVAASLKMSQQTRTPWIDAFLTLDPAQYLGRVKCPVMAVGGSLDTQVDAESNLAIIRKNIPSAEVNLLPGLNHLMQHAVSGDISEYGEIRETISPDLLRMIADFINTNK